MCGGLGAHCFPFPICSQAPVKVLNEPPASDNEAQTASVFYCTEIPLGQTCLRPLLTDTPRAKQQLCFAWSSVRPEASGG